MAEQVLSTVNETNVPQLLSPHQLDRDPVRNRNGRRPSQMTSSLFTPLSQLDLSRTYWELNGELRKKYKNHIFPEINDVLQHFFDSEREGELITVDACMIGKSRETARPTVLFIGGDSRNRKGAKKALQESSVLAKHPDWRVEHTPDFPCLSNTRNDSSVLDGFEFWSSIGTVEWHDEGNSRRQTVDVYFDLCSFPLTSAQIPNKGLAIYINSLPALRPATANIVQLGDRHFLQTVYHAFYPGEYSKKDAESDVIQPKPPALPSIEELTLVGRLLVWSAVRDWALIEILSENMRSQISRSLTADEIANDAFQTAGRPSSTDEVACTWTASSGLLEVMLSETTTYMKLPNSNSFEEVYKARLLTGSWSIGDSGAVIMDPKTGNTFGHILGGNRGTGVAIALAADQVVEDLHGLDFSSHLHTNANDIHGDHVNEMTIEPTSTKAAYDAQVAHKSCLTLHTMIQTFKNHPKRVRDLIEELEALISVLESLSDTMRSHTDTDLPALDLPLRRCGSACDEFLQELQKCCSRSGSDRHSFRDWAKLRYMGDDIDDFKDSLAAYKSTINIALVDMQLRTSFVTVERLEEYRDLIKTATSDLEARLETIDEKLQSLVDRTTSHPPTTELQSIRDERSSTQRCLVICAQFAKLIDELQLSSAKDLPRGSDNIPEKITSDGIEECRASMEQTAARLESHMQEVLDRMMSNSSAAMTQEDTRYLARLREELATARQCRDICVQANQHLKENISVIDNHAIGNDAVQLLVSSSQKTIHGNNREYGDQNKQVGGHLSDESIRKTWRLLADDYS